jgi:hypothetical protein
MDFEEVETVARAQKAKMQVDGGRKRVSDTNGTHPDYTVDRKPVFSGILAPSDYAYGDVNLEDDEFVPEEVEQFLRTRDEEARARALDNREAEYRVAEAPPPIRQQHQPTDSDTPPRPVHRDG